MQSAFETAEKQSQTYYSIPVAAAAASRPDPEKSLHVASEVCAAAKQSSKCLFCGNAGHHSSKCPAHHEICKGCGKQGHFQKMCISKKTSRSDHRIHSSMFTPINSAFTAAAPLVACLKLLSTFLSTIMLSKFLLTLVALRVITGCPFYVSQNYDSPL